MGDTDLSAARPSLAELIRAGDPDVIAGFRDAHVEKVRNYLVQVCAPDRIEEAAHAVFLDFLGRARLAGPGPLDVEDLLLRATRSAAAGRFAVQGSAGHESLCAAVPELLAAAANGELHGGEEALRRHIVRCPTCAGAEVRMRSGERAFTQTPGPALDI